MDWSFLYDLFVKFSPQLVELLLLLIFAFAFNALRKQGATKEQLALLEEAYAILARAARNTNQVWVEAGKEAGGKLSPEEIARARQDTIDTFKNMITEAMQLAIEKMYGSVDKWIELNLESAVNEVKDVQVIIPEFDN